MKAKQFLILWPAGAMATGLIAASAWAQSPVPPTGPARGAVERRGGPIRRFFRHTGHALQDNLIGYPEEFVVPPVGFGIAANFSVMKAKADPHNFTLYATDFLDGTDRFSPNGAARFNLMASRLPRWLGPVIIEWSPDRPGLAESRRLAVLASLERANLPVVPERLLVGPSPYPGAIGSEAGNLYNIMNYRNQAAPAELSMPPNTLGVFDTSSGGGN